MQTAFDPVNGIWSCPLPRYEWREGGNDDCISIAREVEDPDEYGVVDWLPTKIANEPVTLQWRDLTGISILCNSMYFSSSLALGKRTFIQNVRYSWYGTPECDKSFAISPISVCSSANATTIDPPVFFGALSAAINDYLLCIREPHAFPTYQFGSVDDGVVGYVCYWFVGMQLKWWW